MTMTVDDYIDSLPEERRIAIRAVREAVNAKLPLGYEEGIVYGMIAWFVPFTRLAETYNGQPLCVASLGAQKSHMALYLMSVYGDPALNAWFEKAWKATGRKLDMGKSCVRFKKLEDVALDVVTEAISKVPVDAFVAQYETTRANTAEGKKAAEKAAEKVKEVVHKAEDTAKAVVAKAEGKAKAAVARAEGAAKAVVGKASSKAHVVADKARSTAQVVVDKAKSKAQVVAGKAKDAAAKAKLAVAGKATAAAGKAQQAAGKAQHAAGKAKQAVASKSKQASAKAKQVAGNAKQAAGKAKAAAKKPGARA